MCLLLKRTIFGGAYSIAKNISQENLAYEAEIEYSQVSRIERGIINTCISQVFAIAKALNIEPWVLFKFDEV